ncbi:MAG: FapA family protein [Gracilibacteraceae bacterium]|jgi:uncharacterized protein (DUF342 family)|nr:FapA family protein [Gracilibacteraceae bacterium]
MTDSNVLENAPHLCALYRLWRGFNESAPLRAADFYAADLDEEEIRPCWLELDLRAARLLAEWQAPSGAPVPGLLALIFAGDEIKTWVFVFPPYRRGEPVDAEAALAELAARGVTHGIVPSALEAALLHPMRLVLLAVGTPPVHGRDGYVEYLIDAPEKARFAQTADDAQLDFKNLHWLVSVKTGDLLCRIHPPAPALSGLSVRGATIPARPGRPAQAVRGQNTVLSEDGTELSAGIDGTVRRRHGRLDIENTVLIEGDVDFSTGNLNVEGNILIKGSVRTGFRVQASGGIVVQQVVEDATLVAGGDIVIERGMNGNSRGTLRAEGHIRCKFLEHTIVYARGDVLLGSAVNCKIECGGEALVTLAPGCIIGGSITSMKKIEARSVGTEIRHIPTLLSIQLLPWHIDEARRLRTEAKAEQAKLDAIKEMFRKQGEIPPEKAHIAQNLKEQQAALQMKLTKINAALLGITAREQEAARGAILLGTAYPGISLLISGARLRLEETAYSCRYTNIDGEIHCGLK